MSKVPWAGAGSGRFGHPDRNKGVFALLSPKIAVALAAVLLAGAVSSPAVSADEPARKGEQVRKELDLARASDAKVEAEATRLTAELAAQRNRLADAQRAEAVAQSRAEETARRLQGLEERATSAKRQVARAAVDAYVHPSSGGGLSLFAGSGSLEESVRRRALVRVVRAESADSVELLRSVREDQAEAKQQLERASDEAAARTAEEKERARTVEAAQRQQLATHQELQRRISDLRGESQALAAEDARVQALLTRSTATAPSSPSSPSSRRLIWPVRGPITSEFGPRWGSFHAGIDIGDPGGTPIAAAKAGTVVFSGWNGGYGNFVVIDMAAASPRRMRTSRRSRWGKALESARDRPSATSARRGFPSATTCTSKCASTARLEIPGLSVKRIGPVRDRSWPTRRAAREFSSIEAASGHGSL